MRQKASAEPSRPAAIHRQPFFSRPGPQCFLPGARVQPKLTVGAPGDRFEREADRVADQVAAHGIAPPVQRMCTECAAEDTELRRQTLEEEEGPVQAKPEPGGGHAVGDGIAGRLRENRGGGRPLPAPVLQEMSSAFGSDFGGVRVHTDGAAVQLSRDLGAQAFTHGRDIYFNQGKFAPESAGGRHLLAHELTHVLQQGGGTPSDLVQRAEVDDRSCAGLTDIETDVDTKVNAEIAAARSAAGTPLRVPNLLKEVHSRLGNGPVSPIETFIEGLPATKRKLPPSSLTGTKYADVGTVNRFYHLQTLGLAHVVGSAAKVHGICIGADKLGHFFGEGDLYFRVTQAGGTTADARSVGNLAEITIQGLGSTGVFSNADLAANFAGLRFYKDLEADPTGFRFQVKDYITASWNEQTNPSFYDAAVAGVIWKNLLSGVWEGQVHVPGPVQTRITFTVTAGGNVTGDYEYPLPTPTKKGTIEKGKITFLTTSVTGTLGSRTESATPVQGILIEFDWNKSGKGKGKGTWKSAGEQALEGTWGKGASRTGGGAWNLKKA